MDFHNVDNEIVIDPTGRNIQFLVSAANIITKEIMNIICYYYVCDCIQWLAIFIMIIIFGGVVSG